MQQFTLNVELLPHATFANFIANQPNQIFIDYLQSATEPLWIMTPHGEGTTHMLQALCHHSTKPALYVPLKKMTEITPEILQNSETLAVVAIDDIDHIAGHAEWEHALFRTFNACMQTRLLFGAHTPLQQLHFALPDLYSRLQALNQLNFYPLNDLEKIKVLQQQALQRGFTLATAIARYLLKQVPRDLPNLLLLLDQLATLSLKMQRRVTLPLLKQLLYNDYFKENHL